MIVFRTFSNQLTIKDDEYAIYTENACFPNGEETIALVIQTPNKKYSIIGIDSGVLDAAEVIENVMDYIKANIKEQIIYIDLDEICGANNGMETLVTFIKVSDS